MAGLFRWNQSYYSRVIKSCAYIGITESVRGQG